MGRGKTAYIRKVNSNGNADDLIKSLISTVTNNKMDLKKGKKDNRGFFKCSDNNDSLFIRFNEPPILQLKYAYYEKVLDPDPTADEPYRYAYKHFDIWFDISHRIIIFFTSRLEIVALIMKILEGAGIKLSFAQYNEDFFRWIDSKNYKPQPTYRLLKVMGTYIDDLQEDGNTDTISMTTHDDLYKSPGYQLYANDGDRKYFKGIFTYKKLQFVVSVYKNGKITVNKQVKIGPKEDTRLIIPWVYEDVVNIHKDWADQKKV